MTVKTYIRPKHWLIVEDNVSTSLISRAGGGYDAVPMVLEIADEEGNRIRPLQPDNGGGDIDDAHGSADGLPPCAVCVGVGR